MVVSRVLLLALALLPVIVLGDILSATPNADGIGYTGVDIPGGDISNLNVQTPLDCARSCDVTDGCVAWAYDTCGSNTCWLKNNQVGARGPNACREIGYRSAQAVDYSGGDMPNMPISASHPSDCSKACKLQSGCIAWAFDICGSGNCWLKSSVAGAGSPNQCRASAIEGRVGADLSGNDMSSSQLSSTSTSTDCANLCLKTTGCNAFTYQMAGGSCTSTNTCWLKKVSGTPKYSSNPCTFSTVLPVGSGNGGSTTKSGTTGSSGGDPIQTALLKAHNDIRAGKGLGALTWNTKAASVASAWANACNWGHNPDRSGFGENISANAPSGSVTAAMAADLAKGWMDEVSNWNCNDNSCNGECGHYTQVMWASTTSVGCAVVNCNNNSPFGSGFPTWNFLVCDYDPPGNWAGQRPFDQSKC